MLDWKKIGIYAFAAIAGVTIYTFAYTRDHDVPVPTPRPAPPVVVLEPVVAPTPVPASNDHPWPKGYEKPVVQPKSTPKPAPVVKKAAPKARPRPTIPACEAIPAVAYQHPAAEVLAAARRLHRSEAEIEVLRKCLAR